ncbi:hypothetical protein IEQ34_021400 [Dendrobium chrysotoxum]|uniref:Uncharacterized protein n=1 Tax=Dendrobium chrysotoxum TaxID=161865 RepID=A0AAV7G5R9_DENCH|nr:hypothetical protein IEQ34_021400 [Dendrobium chrysotoxum]
MVLQEDGDPNNGGCNDRTGFSPKKPKPNKIPQRGLGIAALEKLRREDQQKRIAAAFSTSENIAATASCAGGIGSGEHLSVSFIAPTPFFPLLEQSTKPCFFGNYALFRPQADAIDGSSPLVWKSIQSESSSNSNSRLPLPPGKLQQEQHRCSLVINNFLSPTLSSGACLQMEPPSNQSYVSINPPSMPEQKLASLKRSWPFQSGSALQCGTDHKRIASSRDDASSSSCPRLNIGAEGEASKLDGSFLSLGLLPVSEPFSMQTIPFQKHFVHCLQHIQKNTEKKNSEALGPPTLYNFMGLPHDLIGSNPCDADTESKD